MRINKKADIVIGLQFGDEGKGKITAAIAKQCDHTLGARYNGGSNAGHTITLANGSVLKLHQIPSAVAYKKAGYIGPGALINFSKLEDEEKHFTSVMGYSPYEYLTISSKAILVTPNHIENDKLFHAKKQGSTSSGIAPAYADFYNRTALLASEMTWPSKSGRELIGDIKVCEKLLLEGAQGYYLNPYNGTYPYTTSSSSHPCSAASNFGFSHHKFKNIIGIAKCYETRSGLDINFDKVLDYNDKYILQKDIDPNTYPKRIEDSKKIQKFGKEIGVTTGRLRAVRLLDLTRLIKAINATGTNILVINKWDILEALSSSKEIQLGLYLNAEYINFEENVSQMQDYIKETLLDYCPYLNKIFYSKSPKNDINWNFLNEEN